MTLPVTFLTDYGYQDEFAGSCRTVIARLAPGASVIDLTHGIPGGDVRRGALALEAAVARAGVAVHLAVVDPGVGGSRRAVAICARDGSYLVGPDNGLLTLAAGALGGVEEAVDISASALRLEPVAPTFHGRDLFAPIAAHLACGRPLHVAGEVFDPCSLIELDLPAPRVEEEDLVVSVLYADGFGNLVLAAAPSALGALIDEPALDPQGSGTPPTQPWRLLIAATPGLSIAEPRLSIAATGGERWDALLGATFADGHGGLVVYGDSSGRLGVALDGGSAAEALGVGRDDELRIAVAR